MLTPRAKESCRWDAVSLGEVMLRLDPGDARVRTTRHFQVWEGGGEYNVARGLRRCFGLRTAVVTAIVDNEVGRLLEDLILQGGVDMSHVRWVPFDGVGRRARNGVNFTERGFGIRPAKGCSDRGHTAASQLKLGDIDWKKIFHEEGSRWFHCGGIFAALSETTPAVAKEAMTAAREAGTGERKGSEANGTDAFFGGSKRVVDRVGRIARTPERTRSVSASWRFKGEQRSCVAAVARVVVLWVALERGPCSGNTGAYCRARAKLPEAGIHRLAADVANRCERQVETTWLWRGRHVHLVDGTTVSMPDTPENQEVYPQPRDQAEGLGFPMARLVVLLSLATGMLVDIAVGPYSGKETGETALLRQRLDRFAPGDIVLADRYYCSYFTIALSPHGPSVPPAGLTGARPP